MWRGVLARKHARFSAALGSRVARSIGARDVIVELERLSAQHGKPQLLRSDNGREFIAASLGDWLAERDVKTAFIEKGSRSRTRSSSASTARCATRSSTATGSSSTHATAAPRTGHDDTGSLRSKLRGPEVEMDHKQEPATVLRASSPLRRSPVLRQ